MLYAVPSLAVSVMLGLITKGGIRTAVLGFLVLYAGILGLILIVNMTLAPWRILRERDREIDQLKDTVAELTHEKITFRSKLRFMR